LANKEKKRSYDAARREAKRAEFRATALRWWKNNLGIRRAEVSARRRRVRVQMPKWTRAKEMKCFYLMAQRVSECLGVKHVVDHVIPLKSPVVSGLHVPGNLQVIPAFINSRKSNHYSLTPDGRRA
jgi:hypothetical protein